MNPPVATAKQVCTTRRRNCNVDAKVATNPHMMHMNTDRRRLTRGTSPAEPSRSHLISSIVGAYREMPGLSLHLQQAARLFGIHPSTCQVVLDGLVNDGQLRRSADGQYRLR
jgi:hypothetical protein